MEDTNVLHCFQIKHNFNCFKFKLNYTIYVLQKTSFQVNILSRFF